MKKHARRRGGSIAYLEANPVDPQAFMPHGTCFLWQPNVLYLHVFSDALIALAYFSIPFVLLSLVRRRPDLPFSAVFRMFSAFIVACGTTHILSIVVIWHPVYWLEGYVKALTAVLSIATAIAIAPLLPRILALRTPDELQRVNRQLETAVAEAERLLRRYEREHYIATTLQTASLGELPSRLGALELFAVYQPAIGDLEIGGDWYDAFELPDGRVIISIGDVAGKGLGASVLMAKMRQAIRVAAQVQVRPAAILDAADRALRLEGSEQFVTAFVGIIDDTERILAYANAGHPPPIVRNTDGTLTELAGGGLPLGLRSREDAQASNTVVLEDGALLALFTDGLIESTHDYAEGERRIHAALALDKLHSAGNPAQYLRDAVLFDGVTDDVAILIVRMQRDREETIRVRFSVDDQGAARSARVAIAQALGRHGTPDEDVLDAEMIFSELVGNIARHAGGMVDVRLDRRGGHAVLHVLDEGRGFQYLPRLPIDMFAENGRGLFIIHELAEEFSIVRRPGEGSHARVVLRSRAPFTPGRAAANSNVSNGLPSAR